MSKSSKDLQKELKTAGASEAEASELSFIAAKLGELKATKKIRNGIHGWRLSFSLGMSAVAGLALGMILVVYSQTRLPGSWLYPVQQVSDRVAVSLRPDYRGVVMMERAQQVKQLVAGQASSEVVIATLDSYKNEAMAYKNTANNYAAFEYCKTNLQQAAAIAPLSEKQAITTTLTSLDSI